VAETISLSICESELMRDNQFQLKIHNLIVLDSLCTI